mmetsp:Transcript_13490/g.39386  ORF Transcript_13490/g.39386 Transcript_13490/m.39386 type:complete len:449 (+) Transcript_13490:63-1409(+)
MAMNGGDVEDPEGKPLLPKSVSRYESVVTAMATPRRSTFLLPVSAGPVEDTMSYEAGFLTSWGAFTVRVKTVWRKARIWWMMFRLLCVSMCVAAAVLALAPNPAQLHTSKFTKIGDFMNMFVGLLLGFFLTTTVTRWLACAKGFLEMFDGIRNLQMNLVALGVPSKKRYRCLRYALLSAWFLTQELACPSDPERKQKYIDDMWETLRALSSGDQPEAYFRLLPEEEKAMADVQVRSSMMWLWVSSYVGRLAQDGDIPGMGTPTFCSLMHLVQSAHCGVISVRASVMVKAPFVYVHLMACLVHINNLVNAVSFGLIIGSALGTLLMHFNGTMTLAHYYKHATSKDLVRDMENLVVTLFINMVGPFLYQSLLEVSISIAEPFCNPDSMLPTSRLLALMETEIHDGNRLAKEPPAWEAPYFKERPRSSLEEASRLGQSEAGKGAGAPPAEG